MFNAQAFGKVLEAALKGDSPTITGAQAYSPEYESGANAVTVATSDAITFENLPLGYYLILSEYPQTISTVTLKVNPADENETGWQITKDMTDAQKQDIIDAYVAAVVTDASWLITT